MSVIITRCNVLVPPTQESDKRKSPASPPIRYDASASSPIACLEMNRNVVHTTVMNTAGTRLIRQFFPFIVRYTVPTIV